MSDKTYLGDFVSELGTSPEFMPYSKVVLWYDDEHAFTSGDDSGRTLEADLPFATQAIADSILQRVKGYVYRPYTAQDALLNPAAELGDGVTVNGMYGVLADVETEFSGLMKNRVSAPADEEIDHEYPYLSPEDRALKRKVTLGESYYGTRITRAKGIESVRIDADGNELARAVFNADELAFYAGSERALYFDIETKRYMYVGDIYVKGNINMSEGTITWGNNNPADGSGISADQAKTIISEELVSSPNIAGGRFLDLNQRSWLEMGIAGTNTAYINHFTDTYGDDPVCVMGYVKGFYPAWVIAPFGYHALEFQHRSNDYPYTYAYGDWDFSNATTTGLYLRFS